MKHYPAYMAAVALTALVSCSVLEDRTPCPGVLVVDASDLHGRMGSGTLRLDLVPADGGPIVSRLVPAERNDTLMFIVPKADYTVCAAAGQEHTQFTSAGTVYGASGIQSDSLFAFSDRVSVTGERTDYGCLFHKQFATVRIINAFATGAEDPFEGMTLKVTSAYGGLNYREMKAAANKFVCTVRPDSGYAYMFRMPRQGDDSIILTITGEDLSHVVPIGEYLREMGYDFDADDMEDVTVGVDLVSMTVSVNIQDWHREEVFAII